MPSCLLHRHGLSCFPRGTCREALGWESLIPTCPTRLPGLLPLVPQVFPATWTGHPYFWPRPGEKIELKASVTGAEALPITLMLPAEQVSGQGSASVGSAACCQRDQGGELALWRARLAHCALLLSSLAHPVV